MQKPLNLQTAQRLYFLGIGGIGMSALAHYFFEEGWPVAGYDRWSNPQVSSLLHLGIAVTHEDHPDAVPEAYRHPDQCLVVLTPAIPLEASLRRYFEAHGFTIRKRAEVLAELANPHFLVAVAGTHGKTTTAVSLAHLLMDGGSAVRAFLGGISQNYQRNYLAQGTASGAVWIVEADEFDRSFHHLKPNIALLTSVDADHLDVYGDARAVVEAFKTFIGGIKPNGTLLCHEDVDRSIKTSWQGHVEVYGEKQTAHWRLECREAGLFGQEFALYHGDEAVNGRTPIPGRHNLLNTTSAIAAAFHCGMHITDSLHALRSFRGIRRRFEIRYHGRDCTYIDDYAHHPHELEAVIQAVRHLSGERTITGIFQPHLYSRTRDFAKAFGAALSLLDQVVLLPIYPAREMPIAGVSSAMLALHITHSHVITLKKTEVVDWVAPRRDGRIVLTLGAGDIDQLVAPLTQMLEKSEPHAF